jgi:hypothetical protein
MTKRTKSALSLPPLSPLSLPSLSLSPPSFILLPPLPLFHVCLRPRLAYNQGDQTSPRKNRPKCGPTQFFCQNSSVTWIKVAKKLICEFL